MTANVKEDHNVLTSLKRWEVLAFVALQDFKETLKLITFSFKGFLILDWLQPRPLLCAEGSCRGFISHYLMPLTWDLMMTMTSFQAHILLLVSK